MNQQDIVIIGTEGASTPICIKTGVVVLSDDLLFKADMYANPRNLSSIYLKGWSAGTHSSEYSIEDWQRYQEQGQDNWATYRAVMLERNDTPFVLISKLSRGELHLLPWEKSVGIPTTPPGEFFLWVPEAPGAQSIG